MQFRLIIPFVFIFSFAFSIVDPTLAEVRQGNKVSIDKEEVIEDDVYVFAQEVIVDGTIEGDLIAFGRQITINGAIGGDLIVAGQQVLVNGSIADDVRAGCQILTLQDAAVIGDDLIAAGHSLECTHASRIGGDVRFAGYQSLLAGSVDKKVSLASAKCCLSGSFGDDVEAIVNGGNFGPVAAWGAEFPTIPTGLTVTESANIAGSLNYQSSDEAIISQESTIEGEVTHSEIDSSADQPMTIAERALAFVKQFFALLLVGVLVVYLRPSWTGQVVNILGRRPLASLAWGVLTLIVAIVTAVLILVTTIAIAVLLGSVSLDNLIAAWLWVGLLTTAVVIVGFWIFSAWVAKVIVSIWAGNRIINVSDWTLRQRFIALGLGALILSALLWIPTVGAAVSVFVMLMGLGSTAIGLFERSQLLVSGKADASNPAAFSQKPAICSQQRSQMRSSTLE